MYHYVVIAEIRKKVKVAKSIMVTVTIFCHKNITGQINYGNIF